MNFINQPYDGRLFLLRQPPSILCGFGHELGATLDQLPVLKFFPVRGVQEVKLDQFMTLNSFEILLELPEHLLNFRVGLLSFFFLFGPGAAVTETQGHGPSDESSAYGPEAGDTPSERGGHFRRLILIKTQILPEDLNHGLRSI